MEEYRKREAILEIKGLDNRCFMCGSITPEGRQVCPTCEVKAGQVQKNSATIMYWKPEKTDDLALNDCPFCGYKEPVYEKYMHGAGPRWRVLCLGCMAMIDPGYAQNRHTVQQMWNRRANDGL